LCLAALVEEDHFKDVLAVIVEAVAEKTLLGAS